jgi:uncharacterized membrane-anchored protein
MSNNTDSVLLFFKGNYLIVGVVIVFVLIVTFIEGKITEKDYDTDTYIKVSLLSGIIAFIVTYINNLKGFIKEPIHSGPAPF